MPCMVLVLQVPSERLDNLVLVGRDGRPEPSVLSTAIRAEGAVWKSSHVLRVIAPLRSCEFQVHVVIHSCAQDDFVEVIREFFPRAARRDVCSLCANGPLMMRDGVTLQ